ncbi:MAG: D-2-hydroxyacid dehydrogenase [Dehalococcoidales bacterium]|nr:D-2-hydroxyacid dehydrogenase [Dehalococcoidales bacterium]
MNTINVVLASRLEEDLQRRVAAADKRIKVIDATDVFEASLPGAAPGNRRAELDSLLREAEVLLMPRAPWPPDIFSQTPKLRWVQYIGAGVDSAAARSLLDTEYIVTNSRGTQNIPISEYVMAVMLMFVKMSPRCFANKQARRWQKIDFLELHGKTLGIVGLGSIGNEIIRLARAFSMRIVATRKSAVKKESSVMGVDTLYPPQDLLEMLGECDFVVMTVALTDETKKMIGERELKAMKPTGVLINVARGGVVDQAMLIRALKEGWIGGAGLDVFEKEPLVPESELWELPNVIISPHVSARSEMRNVRLTDLFCENLKRYANGQQPLINEIDRAKGY